MKHLNLKIISLSACLILIGGIFFISKIVAHQAEGADEDENAVFIAQDDPFDELSYPIAELGNCADKESCGAYCDKPKNMEPCLSFAKANNLMPQEDIEMAERMLALGETGGPGGCKGRRACENYCDEIANIKECIVFAEKNNLIPQDELEEAKKVISAIDKGLTPPKCKGKKECDVYCSKPQNMEECITFAQAAGLMPAEEAKDAEKMLAAIKKGVKPPNCGGREACDQYCSQPANMEECMEFALAAGFMPEEEIENAKKSLEAIKKGVMPPNCRGKEECDVYCSQPANAEACMNFAIAAGFIPPEEAENVKKTLEALKKGVFPPKCSGKEECDVYCSQPEHNEECLNFAEAAGFISPEEAQRAREGGGAGPGGCKSQEECETFCSKPENMETCIEFGVERGDISPEEAERMRQQPQLPPGEAPEGGLPGLPQGFEGKCDSPESCFQYCSQNFQDPACQTATENPGGNLTPPADGQIPPPPPPEGFTPPEGIAPPPETTSPPPAEPEQQTLFQWTKKMLANILSAILPF